MALRLSIAYVLVLHLFVKILREHLFLIFNLWPICVCCKQKKYVSEWHSKSVFFLEVVIGVIGFQALFGTFFVIYFGLCTATREAGSHLVSRDADDHDSEPLVGGGLETRRNR